MSPVASQNTARSAYKSIVGHELTQRLIRSLPLALGAVVALQLVISAPVAPSKIFRLVEFFKRLFNWRLHVYSVVIFLSLVPLLLLKRFRFSVERQASASIRQTIANYLQWSLLLYTFSGVVIQFAFLKVFCSFERRDVILHPQGIYKPWVVNENYSFLLYHAMFLGLFYHCVNLGRDQIHFPSINRSAYHRIKSKIKRIVAASAFQAALYLGASIVLYPLLAPRFYWFLVWLFAGTQRVSTARRFTPLANFDGILVLWQCFRSGFLTFAVWQMVDHIFEVVFTSRISTEYMPDSVNKLVDGLTLRKASTAKAFAFLELLSIARYDKTRKSCIYTEQQLDDHRSVWEIVLSSSLEVINDLSTRVEKSAETSKSSTTATAKAATSLQSRSTGFQRPTAYPRLHNPSPSKVQAFVDKLGKLVYRSDDELRGYDDNVLEPLNVLQPDAKRPARDGDLVGSGAQPPSLGQGERHPSLRHRLRPEDPVNGGISSKPITATGPAEPIQRRIVSRLAGGEQLPSAQPPKARVVDQGAVPRLEDAQTLWQMIDAISVVILKRAEGTILGNWKASLKEAAMFSKIQIYIWSIQALSTLCIMSVGLDTHGYVQNSVPQVIESLLRCIDALEKIRSVKAYRLIGGVSTLATFFEFFGYKQNRDCEILLDVLKNSVYQITSKFYDRFNDDQYFQFSAKYADRLQQFLDFDA